MPHFVRHERAIPFRGPTEERQPREDPTGRFPEPSPGEFEFPEFEFPEREFPGGGIEYPKFKFRSSPSFKSFSRPSFEEPEYEAEIFKPVDISEILGQTRQQQAVTGRALSSSFIRGITESALQTGAEQAVSFASLEDIRKRQERARVFGEYTFETELQFSAFMEEQQFALKRFEIEQGLAFDNYALNRGLSQREYEQEKGQAFQEYALERGLSFDEFQFNERLDFDRWRHEQTMDLEREKLRTEKDSDSWCCFIFIEAYGGLLDIVRRYRDEHMTDRNRRGYYRLADRIVPLMKKSKLFKRIVRIFMTDPMVSYGKYFYKQGKIGIIFKPIADFWLKVFDLLGNKPYIRKNGEVL